MNANKSQIVLNLSLCYWLVGCFSSETPDRLSIPAAFEVTEIGAYDWSGNQTPLDAIARKPKIVLKISEKAQESNQPAMLIRGRAEEQLRQDLEEAPLRNSNETRAVACEVGYRDSEIVLVPSDLLERGQSYTVALAGWARSATGKRLNQDATSFVAEVTVSTDFALGAQAIGSWPPDGAAAVAPNLDFAAIAFDGEVHGAEQATWLEDAAGLAVPASVTVRSCEQVGWSSGTCAVIVPSAPLAQSAQYRLVVGSLVSDGRGAPVEQWSAQFTTGAAVDLTPPRWQVNRCAQDEQEIAVGCSLTDDQSVAVRVQPDEPIRVQISAGQKRASAVSPRSETALLLQDLGADEPVDLRVQAVDYAGNLTNALFTLRTRPPQPKVSIAEIRADPRGPEPDQEFVELLNWGDHVIDLKGFSLSDDPYKAGQIIGQSALIYPGSRALLVSDDFDPDNVLDESPPPGTTLVHVGSALTGDGLSNAGKPLFLRDPNGARISSAPATPKPEPGVCIVRAVEDQRDGSPRAFAYDPQGGCTPGR
jgi:hypothetical protein